MAGLLLLSLLVVPSAGFSPSRRPRAFSSTARFVETAPAEEAAAAAAGAGGAGAEPYDPFQGADSLMALKAQVLQLGASLDRGQSYNPTSGDYYAERFEAARAKVKELIAKQPAPADEPRGDRGEWGSCSPRCRMESSGRRPFSWRCRRRFSLRRTRRPSARTRRTCSSNCTSCRRAPGA